MNEVENEKLLTFYTLVLISIFRIACPQYIEPVCGLRAGKLREFLPHYVKSNLLRIHIYRDVVENS